MLNKFPLLPFIAFVSGFSLLVFELAAARVLAPSIGSSTYVWTSVIGVIIAALSIGYWVGGKLADRRARLTDIAWICLGVAATTSIVLLIYLPMLEWVVMSFEDARVQGVVASLLLFAPTSFLIGLLSPYLVKLRVTSLKTSGQSFASLSALESIGGITGTFVTGFILFGFIGSRETFAVVVFILLASSWVVNPRQSWRGRLVASVIIAVVCVVSLQGTNAREIDTPSAHYSIIEVSQGDTTVRGIATGPNGTQSGIYVNQPDKLLFWYTQQIADVIAEKSDNQRILVLGGGAFTLPQHLANTYPNSTIDVVEIDPELAAISRTHFDYRDPKNVNLIFEDARTYVNRSAQQYDVIIVDVYSDASVPFSLMTAEYGRQIKRLLTDDGIVAVNMIAGLRGPCMDLLRALDAPYRQELPRATYKIQQPDSPLSNTIVVYAKQPFSWQGSAELNLTTEAAYTDNFTPVERLQQSCRNTV